MLVSYLRQVIRVFKSHGVNLARFVVPVYLKLQIKVKQNANKVHLLRAKNSVVILQNYGKFIKLWLKYNKVINKLFPFSSLRRWP